MRVDWDGVMVRWSRRRGGGGGLASRGLLLTTRERERAQTYICFLPQQ